MGLGSTSIYSSLLHDVVEDTDYTVEDISNIFGAKIAQIVDGLTKISAEYSVIRHLPRLKTSRNCCSP
jgi:(p)ppGpp synthase/HD superfamily hydrolase